LRQEKGWEAWTDEQKAEFQRRVMMGERYADIAIAMNTTESALGHIRRRYNLASPERIRMNAQDRQKGRPFSGKLTKAKRAKINQERWAQDGYREKVGAKLKEFASSPAGHAARQAASFAKRGFHVPPELAADYKHLTYYKKIPAREAAVILGILKEEA
jgi:hypothetical protein